MSDRSQRWSSPPPMEINTSAQYEAVLHTTAGDFTIELFTKQSPVAVNNFIFLARHDFFNGDQFFRVVPGFVIQTGDPLNNGTGGPGYKWNDELPVPYAYAPGIVAMANAGPNTNGSQWFICTGPQSAGLNQMPNYTQFGRVVSGMSVVEKIGAGEVRRNPMSGEVSQPIDPIVIESVTIHETPAS